MSTAFDDALQEGLAHGLYGTIRDPRSPPGLATGLLLGSPTAAEAKFRAPGILGRLSGLAESLRDFQDRHRLTLAQCAPSIVGTPPTDPGATERSFNDEYGRLMKSGGVDITQNGKEAAELSPMEFYDHVKTGGKWDYKKGTDRKMGVNPRFPGIPADDIQKFGNANFGYVGAAYGLPLWMLVQGAGLYQTFSQDKKPWRGLSQGAFANIDSGDHAPGLWNLPDDQIRALADQGCQFGDLEGDSDEIIKGYDLYHARHPAMP